MYDSPHVFNLEQKVFLWLPHDAKTLAMSKCVKLAPQFCTPFTVLKCIGSSTYCLSTMLAHFA